MRVIFMGTPSFAQIILDELVKAGIDVVAVVTRPDAVRGRGKALQASPVKQCAQSHEIPVIETKTLKTDEVQARLASYHADLFVVAAYGALLPKEILDLPRLGCLNVHASLLPRWRGAAPIQRALLAGDERQGVCIMRMEEGLDTGDYCRAASCAVDQKDVDTITRELAYLGAHELIDVLHELTDKPSASLDDLVWTSQDEGEVTYAHKIEKHEVRPCPELSMKDNVARIRAASDAAPARCIICGKSVRILSARLLGPHHRVSMQPGEVSFAHNCLYLACADGIFEVLSLKPDGKGVQEAQVWMRGIKTNQRVWSALS